PSHPVILPVPTRRSSDLPIGCNGSAFPWTVRGDDGRLGFGTRVGVVTRCIGDDYPSSSPRRVVIGTAPSIAGATKRHGHAALDGFTARKENVVKETVHCGRTLGIERHVTKRRYRECTQDGDERQDHQCFHERDARGALRIASLLAPSLHIDSMTPALWVVFMAVL